MASNRRPHADEGPAKFGVLEAAPSAGEPRSKATTANTFDVAGARTGIRLTQKSAAKSFTEKRAHLTTSMAMAAKAAQFEGFVATVRGILCDITIGKNGEWIPELDESLLQALECCKSQRQFLDCLHRANLNAQQKGTMFRLLTAIRDAKHLFEDDDDDDTEYENAILESVDQAKSDILALCTYDFLKGRRAVGENPLHIAFLFGLHDFGQEMIDTAAAGAEDPESIRRQLIQRPYLNDLDPWFELAIRAQEDDSSTPNGPSLARRLSVASIRTSHAGSWSNAQVHPKVSSEADLEAEAEAEQRDMTLRFKQLLLRKFPTADDQREARMPYNLLDATNVAGRDGGLFTGETLLHLAIVQHLEGTVEWLLEHGAALDARAAGIFFQPDQVECFGVKQQQFLARYPWFANISALIFDIGSQREKNSWGGTCYYGEFPLSFAASVGDVHICHILQRKAQSLLIQGLQHLHDHDDNTPLFSNRDEPYAAKFLASLYLELGDQDGADQSISHQSFDINAEVKKLMDVFVNRSDARGNTALHMAVMHKKMASITYLLANGARASLRALNEHHLTPITLAVRKGDTDMFQHLVSQLEITAWEFGSARMVVQPLEQIDTFRTSALIGGAKKKKRRTMGSSQRGLFGKLRDTVTDVANTAAHKSTAMAATAIDAASSAAQGVGRFAKDTVQDVGFGLGLHAHGGAKGLRGISALVNSKSLDLRAHKEFFSKMVARANLSAVEFATNVEGSVNMKMKTTTTGSPIELWELHSNPNYRCALTIVVQHEVDSFFDVPVFAKLVEDKWQRFGYRMHLRRVLAYAFFVFVTTFALDHRSRGIRRAAFGKSDEPDGKIFCFMYAECSASMERPLQYGFDIILYLLGIPYLLLQSYRNRRVSLHDFDPNGDLDWSLNELFFFIYKNLTTLLSLLTVGFLTGSLADRSRNGIQAFWDSDPFKGRESGRIPSSTELQCLALVTIFMYCNLLHMLLPFQSLGPVLITIWRMLMSDVVRWIVVYVFLLMAFSQAIIIAVQDIAIFQPDLEEALEQGVNGISISKTSLNTLDFVKYYVLVTLGDVSQPVVWYAGRSNYYIWMMHIIFLVLSTLLLLNLIIAMMGETYAREKSNEGAAMWWMMKAARVIDYENQLPREKQIRYRSGVDPFTAGQEKDTVPFYHIEVSEADDGHDGGVKKEVRNLTDLRKTFDLQFQRLEKRQKAIILESTSQFDLSETRQNAINDKLEAILRSMGMSSAPSAALPKSPGHCRHHSPFFSHESRNGSPFLSDESIGDVHHHPSPSHRPQKHLTHATQVTPSMATTTKSSFTPLTLVTEDCKEAQGESGAQSKPAYSSALPRRQLKGLPPIQR